MKLTDNQGRPRDFFFELQKHSCHLRSDFLARQLAIYELFKRVIEIPGAIVEFGVRNGANFFYLARLLELFNSGQRYDGISSKHLFGFDTFSGFPSIHEKDQAKTAWPDMRVGGVQTDREVFFSDYESFRANSPIRTRLHVIEGDVMSTLCPTLDEWPGIRFSLVYLDLDLFEPTLYVLEQVWDRIPKGGIVVFDEYALPEFPGETAAIDTFFADKQQQIATIPWCFSPSAYITRKTG